MKIAITGHRPNKLGNDYDLTSDLIVRIKIAIHEAIRKVLIEKNLEQKDVTFITGMALGIDTLFAQIAIEYKIPFIAAIPCKTQHLKWPYKSRERYLQLLSKAYSCTLISEEYNDSCMQLRNEWMVNRCDLLIAVWDGTPGGTANCVKYARSVDKRIVFINPKEL